MKFLLALIPLCIVAMGGTTLSLAEVVDSLWIFMSLAVPQLQKPYLTGS